MSSQGNHDANVTFPKRSQWICIANGDAHWQTNSHGGSKYDGIRHRVPSSSINGRNESNQKVQLVGQ